MELEQYLGRNVGQRLSSVRAARIGKISVAIAQKPFVSRFVESPRCFLKNRQRHVHYRTLIIFISLPTNRPPMFFRVAIRLYNNASCCTIRGNYFANGVVRIEATNF